jgi:hypothetical protein
MKPCKIFYKIFIALSICFLCIEQGVVNISVQHAFMGSYRATIRGMPYGGMPYGGHDSYVIGRFRCNPLKLLKNTFGVKHSRNDNDYHLHLQQNICQPLKLSFFGHSKAPTMRCYPLPYTTLPWPLSTYLMALYVPLLASPLE